MWENCHDDPLVTRNKAHMEWEIRFAQRQRAASDFNWEKKCQELQEEVKTLKAEIASLKKELADPDYVAIRYKRKIDAEMLDRRFN